MSGWSYHDGVARADLHERLLAGVGNLLRVRLRGRSKVRNGNGKNQRQESAPGATKKRH